MLVQAAFVNLFEWLLTRMRASSVIHHRKLAIGYFKIERQIINPYLVFAVSWREL